MYAENADYVFMAQQACERSSIEREIHMAMSHGAIDSNEKGEPTLVPSDDAFSIFQKIPGTPAYWKLFRNELYARMEQLGPFHLFFTISCAEMRWACVLLEVLKVKRKRKLKSMYMSTFDKSIDLSWNGEESTVLVYDKDLNVNEIDNLQSDHVDNTDEDSEWK